MNGAAVTHGRDTAIYQELVVINNRIQDWAKANDNDFHNDVMKDKVRMAQELLEEVAEELNTPL
jgi:hypothetical protein